jgi:predicted pyridoxine 5'-phosphate oxidase superfamily flavin-nucleotide-binding protein
MAIHDGPTSAGTGYTPTQRGLQDRFDTRRIADRIDGLLVHDRFTDEDRAFLEARDMVFLATVDAAGRPTCSYKGGDPGFVRVLDDRTLALPSYDGNGMFLSLGNLLVRPEVGLLFVDFEQARRMRVHGTAEVAVEDPLLATWPGAQAVIRVTARQVFPNCGRYVHRYALVERSAFVPRPHRVVPVPSWKRDDWALDALPAGDPAREPGDRPVCWR